jgi:hypothetical protein
MHVVMARHGQKGDLDLVLPGTWSELPESTDSKQDMIWAYNNLHCIKDRPGKAPLIYWGRCTLPPTRASHGMLSFAAENRHKFMSEMVPKATGQTSDENSEGKRGERKAIAEIEAILGKISEGA